MTLSDYLTLVSIAESKSITLAAGKMNLTKSAVSHSLSKIEKEVGCPIFNRAEQQWTLTDAGQHLLPFAYAVLKTNDRFGEAVHELKNLSAGSVSIGACSSTCINWIPDILNGFRKLYPNVKVSVKGGLHNAQVAEFLDKNEIDIGIATENSAKPFPKLKIISLYPDEMLCITHKNFISKTPGIISCEEMESMPLIMPYGGFGAEALAVLEANGISPETSIESIDDASLIAMVAGGLGYTILGSLIVKGTPQSINTYSFSPPQFRDLSLLYNGAFPPSPACKAMLDFIKDYVDDYLKREEA